MASLGGRVAFVTGSNRGLGKAVAIALGGSGVNVGMVARGAQDLALAADEVRTTGAEVVAGIANVADESELLHALQAVRSELGSIDILINNAGVVWPIGQMVEVNLDDWKHTLEINLFGPLTATKFVLPHMLERGFGRIVNLSSGAVDHPETGNLYNAYVTSKAALETHSVNLGAQLQGTGVTVNSFRPGPVDSAMQAWIRSQPPEAIGAAFHEQFVSRHENGTLVPPEIAAARLIELLESDRNAEVIR